MDDELYNTVVKILSNEAPRRKDWTSLHHLAFKKIRRNDLTLDKIYDPLTGQQALHLIADRKIFPKKSSVENIIEMMRKETAGDGATKLHHRYIYCFSDELFNC